MNELTTTENNLPLSPTDVARQAELIQEVMRDVMKEDVHYGIIPGCGDKPTLYKAGAEKLLFTFRLRAIVKPENISVKDLPGGHKEFMVIASVLDQNDRELATGMSVRSTMESKYAFRKTAKDTGKNIPDDYKENKAAYKAQGFGAKKINGEWKWVQYENVETNPADNYNTVLKMAHKSAKIDATIGACAASDVVTQDLEDLKDVIAAREAEKKAEQEAVKPDEVIPPERKDTPKEKKPQEPKEEKSILDMTVKELKEAIIEKYGDSVTCFPRSKADLMKLLKNGPDTSEKPENKPIPEITRTRILDAFKGIMDQEQLEELVGLPVAEWTTFEQKKLSLIIRFARQNVGYTMLEEKLNSVPVKDWSLVETRKLNNLVEAITKQETTIEDEFPVG